MGNVWIDVLRLQTLMSLCKHHFRRNRRTHSRELLAEPGLRFLVGVRVFRNKTAGQQNM